MHTSLTVCGVAIYTSRCTYTFLCNEQVNVVSPLFTFVHVVVSIYMYMYETKCYIHCIYTYHYTNLTFVRACVTGGDRPEVNLTSNLRLAFP